MYIDTYLVGRAADVHGPLTAGLRLRLNLLQCRDGKLIRALH